ncbi:MAG: hotdog domain-containing protein [Candidatus Planktophila sp.]|mgnify:FL=1|nr:hotdog domain-containing protein [Candidatus Planktophila sp.]
MKPAEEILGAVGFSVMAVRPGDTCVALGVGDIPVVSQSHLINLMEHAIVISLDEYLEPGETTVAISIELISLSPAEIGAELRATSRCIEVENRELTFECELYEGERQVAAAIIKRATVERVSFLARTAAQSLIS